MPLSPRQHDTYEFVRSYIREHGVAPARVTIAQALGWKDKSTANVVLSAIERKGWIELKMNQPRYIRLLHDDIPVVATGPIGAGEDMLALNRIIDQVPRAVAQWFSPEPDFFLELRDDAMLDAGLGLGDLVAVSTSTEVPATGEIVVVCSRGEMALRRLCRVDDDRLGLSTETRQGANVEQMVRLEDGEMSIEGVMIGALVGRRPAADTRGGEVKKPSRGKA